MKATWDKLENNWMQFEVEVEADQFAKAMDSAFQKLNQRVNIPGFRRGKAPRALFERMYGKESLVQEAVDALLPTAYSDAVAQGDVHPIDRPDLAVEQAEAGKSLVFKGKVQVRPEVTLGRVTGFNIPQPSAEVTAEQIDQQLETLRTRATTLVTDESGEVKPGSFVIIDYEGFVDDVAFEGGKGENHTLEIGSGSFIPGFEEGLIGAKVGEDRNVNATFPEQYGAEHLAGKTALFKVTVKEVKYKVMPELNDEFAAEAGPFQTLQELRADIENRLKESAKANAEREYQNSIIEAVSDDAAVEIPEVLVHQRVHDMLHDFAHDLERKGLNWELYTQITGKTEHELHAEFEGPAKKGVKADLVMAAVAKQEGITVAEADMESEFDRMLAVYKDQQTEIKQLRKSASYRERMREGLLMQKTIDFLVKANTAPQA